MGLITFEWRDRDSDRDPHEVSHGFDKDIVCPPYLYIRSHIH